MKISQENHDELMRILIKHVRYLMNVSFSHYNFDDYAFLKAAEEAIESNCPFVRPE